MFSWPILTIRAVCCVHRYKTETVLIYDLMTLVFDLSTSKLCHGPPMLPSWKFFSLICPSILDLGSCTGQTNRQTDRPQSTMHMLHPIAMGRNKTVRGRGRLGGARRFGTPVGGEVRGHIVAAARLQLVLFFFLFGKRFTVCKYWLPLC